MERRNADPEKKKKRMPGCWTVVKQRGKHGQSIGSVTRSVQNGGGKAWKIGGRNEELKIKNWRKRAVQGKDRSGM